VGGQWRRWRLGQALLAKMPGERGRPPIGGRAKPESLERKARRRAVAKRAKLGVKLGAEGGHLLRIYRDLAAFSSYFQQKRVNFGQFWLRWIICGCNCLADNLELV